MNYKFKDVSAPVAFVAANNSITDDTKFAPDCKNPLTVSRFN